MTDEAVAENADISNFCLRFWTAVNALIEVEGVGLGASSAKSGR